MRSPNKAKLNVSLKIKNIFIARKDLKGILCPRNSFRISVKFGKIRFFQFLIFLFIFFALSSIAFAATQITIDSRIYSCENIDSVDPEDYGAVNCTTDPDFCTSGAIINNQGYECGDDDLISPIDYGDINCPTDPDACVPVDSDGDGFYTPEDCDDADAMINPNATESCDGIDNNCNGVIDEYCKVTINNATYACKINDSINPEYYGAVSCSDDPNSCMLLVCTDNDNDGYATEGGDCGLIDCDDSNININPDAPEICDRKDNDCDGTIPADEIDSDGDGMTECEGDCNDNDNTIYLDASELCDRKDNDCNGLIDDHDQLPPATTDNAPINWINHDAEITLAATDNICGVNTTYYCVDAANTCAPNIEGTNISVTEEGTTYLRYYSTDNSGFSVGGNVESTKSTIIKIDKTDPMTSLDLTGSLGNNEWYLTDVNASITAADLLSGVNNSYVCSNQDNNCTPALGNSILMTSEGNNFAKYYSADNAGNIELTNTNLIKIDKTDPVIEIAPLSQYDGDGIVQIIWNGIDSVSGIAYYELYKNNSLILTTTNSSYIDSGLADAATYTYYVKAYDNAGRSTISSSTNVTIDLFPPTVPDMYPLPQYTTKLNVYADWNKSYDAVSGVAYYVLYKNNISYISTGLNTHYNDSSVLEGLTYSYQATATDNVYHESNRSDTATTTIDTIPPATNYSIEGVTGDNGWYKEQNVYVTLAASDATSGVKETFYKINADNYTTYTGTFNLSDGIYIVDYYSVDYAGNKEEEKNFIVKVDTQPPFTTDNSDELWHNTNVSLNLAAVDNLAGVSETYYCTDHINNCTPGTIGNNLIIAEEGYNYIRYYSKDYAGNLEDLKSAIVKIDKTPPLTTDDYIYGGVWSNVPLNVGLNATDPEPSSGLKWTKYCFDTAGICDPVYGGDCDGTEQQCSPVNGTDYAADINLTEGNYNLRYSSKDIAGNLEEMKLARILFDATPPKLNITIGAEDPAVCDFWLQDWIDSANMSWSTIHGCAKIDIKSNEPLNLYTLKLLDPNEAIVLNATNTSIVFNFDTPQTHYQVVAEGFDRADNLGTESMFIYESDDMPGEIANNVPTVPDIMDVCPTTAPLVDAEPIDGCEDSLGSAASAFDYELALLTGAAKTSINPDQKAINQMLYNYSTDFRRWPHNWYGIKSTINDDTISFEDVNAEFRNNFTLKQVTAKLFNVSLPDGTLLNLVSGPDWFNKPDKIGKIREHHTMFGNIKFIEVDLQKSGPEAWKDEEERWKLDLKAPHMDSMTQNYDLRIDDGSKIKAKQHYNLERNETKIVLTYKNEELERACKDDARKLFENCVKDCDKRDRNCHDSCRKEEQKDAGKICRENYNKDERLIFPGKVTVSIWDILKWMQRVK